MPTIELKYVFADEAELRAHLGVSTAVPVIASTAPVDLKTVVNPVQTPTVAEPTRADKDADGMPYNEAVHADPPSFTENGLWRAKRGQKEAADAARAAFKASGGGIVAPEVKTEVVTAPVAQVLPAAPALPGMTLPAPAPAPVTMESLVEAIGKAMESGKLPNVVEFYQKHTGSNDMTVISQAIETNESIRRKMLDDIAGL